MIAKIAQPLQALINVEKSRLAPHCAFSSTISAAIESESQPSGQVFKTVQLVPFTFDGVAVRVVKIDGEPWFVLNDVCRVLERSNPSMAAKGLDDDEVTTIDALNNSEGVTDPRAQNIRIINESGLYALVLTSRKPSAKRFKKWVTAEVLPQIRKTGRYDTNALHKEASVGFQIMRKARNVLYAEQRRQRLEAKAAKKAVLERKPA